MRTRSIVAAIAAFAGVLGVGLGALAAQPEPWQVNMQPAVTPIALQTRQLLDLVHGVTAFIVAVVLGLMCFVFWRFNAKANPTPSKMTHNTALEIVWTVIPLMIVTGIAIRSILLVYAEDAAAVDADLTVKVVGHQWYWTYQYPDQGFEFDAFLVDEADLEEGQPRLLETDNHMTVPINTTVRVLVTSSPDDVIHSWAVPAFGVKMDAVPGRLNQTWFRADREGTYYGQCSELCGIYHGYMPITVDVVSAQRYQAWVTEAKERFAATGPEAGPELARVSE